MTNESAARGYDKFKQKLDARKELNRLDDEHWSVGASYRQRVTTKKVKYLLLHHKDTIVRDADVCRLHVEKLGFGVCDISFQNPKSGA
jgi:hypothetical protein